MVKRKRLDETYFETKIGLYLVFLSLLLVGIVANVKAVFPGDLVGSQSAM